jgi:hypothetical protein
MQLFPNQEFLLSGIYSEKEIITLIELFPPFFHSSLLQGGIFHFPLTRRFGPFPVLIITCETSPHCSPEIPSPDFILLKKPIPEGALREGIGEILARSREP